MIDLAGLWKSKEAVKDEKGIFLIQQNENELSIHGIGIENDCYDNIGFGKIDKNEEFINGVWEDTPYSANPENCKKHSFKAKIISANELRAILIPDEKDFGYGDFIKVYDHSQLKTL